MLRRIQMFRRLSILPGHFYSPVLMPEEIAGMEEKLFSTTEKTIHGIDMNESYQLELLNKMLAYYADLPFTHEPNEKYRYYYDNKFFSYNSGIELFCLLRTFKPKRIIEVGSGFSSALMLDANELFFNREMQLTFIEPYPENRLSKLMKKEDGGSAKVYPTKLQDVDPSIFAQLEENDILFIDSSHVSKPGSDVNMILFDILPVLKKGVIIHFHDIFYPFEYPRNWVMNSGGFGWNELYLLRAFLMYNNVFDIIFLSSFMEEKHKSWFEANMPLCLKKQGGSIYLKKR